MAAGYSPSVAYVDQFDHLVRGDDRGRAIKNTRTIVVFDDGLVVCAVRVYGDTRRPAGGILGSLRRGRPGGAGPGGAGPGGRQQGDGDEQIRASALAAGSCLTFAPTWPNARLIPFAVVDRVVLTRPRQVSELAIYEQTADPASPAAAIFLGDLSASQVRAALGSRLGDRLDIQVPASGG
jgi:hypothetical protein